VTGRRNFRGLALLLGWIAAATGCTIADTGSFERLQNEVVAMKRDMAALKASQPGASAAAGRADGAEIQSLRKNYADLNNDFDRVKSDLLAATSRMDEARVEMERITSRQNEIERALQEMRGNAERIKELERRMAAQEEKLGKPGATPAARWGKAPRRCTSTPSAR
jgi:chromosome segregation ATPase